ncbi:MAG: protein kinase domain-containing protein [Vicinamibacterales bacterium]
MRVGGRLLAHNAAVFPEVGSQLGAYEILSLLGEGGMGRVFRARDVRLKRDVAIKALSDELAFDADRIARFRREAEALAALNHPHIAGIHDLLEVERSQFLVLELVEGETIADRLRRGPIPEAEAVRIARQIVNALEVAHARGIVHRDLKPANIKLTPTGQVKVLDFGLAKVLAAADEPSRRNPPTLTTPAMTQRGVILGTAAYMSPEQARGQWVDAQADIWAIGCVLYEMLTRRPPFTGPTVTDVLAAVVRAEPDWSALPPQTATRLRSLMRRCLQKDAGKRLHHIADVRIELDEYQEDQVVSATIAKPASARLAWTAVAAVSLVALGLAYWLLRALQPGPAPSEMRLEISTPPTTDPVFLALSPDGQKLVFVASGDGMSRLWVRSLDSTTARPLPGSELPTSPFWSPDGRSIGFFADGKLKRIDLDGGLVQTIAGAPVGVGGAWNRDGAILFSPNAVGALFVVPATGGQPRQVTTLAAGENHRFPQFLPDHRHFLYYNQTPPQQLRGIYLGALDGAEPRRLMDAESAGVLTASGHILFVRQGTLVAQAFDTTRYELRGEPFAVADQIAVDGTISLASVATSPAGPFAFRIGGARGQRQLTWYDRSGQSLGAVGQSDAAALLNPELSRDDRFVAVNRTIDVNTDVWQVETARGIPRRFTFDASVDQLPVWSPDGRRIVYSSNRTNVFDLYSKAASGPGTDELLLSSTENKFAMSFSSDSRLLLYRNTGLNTNWDLWVLPLEPKGPPIQVTNTPFQEMIGEFSSDGRWVAYQSNEAGRFEIYIQSFPEPTVRAQVSTNGGSQPRWRRDGKELFFMALDGRLMAAPISVEAQGQIMPGPPVALFMTRTAGGPVPSPQKQQYAVSADGRRFLLNGQSGDSASSPITLVLNWKPPRSGSANPD